MQRSKSARSSGFLPYRPSANFTKSFNAKFGLPWGCQFGCRVSSEDLSANINPRNVSITSVPPTGPSCGVLMVLPPVTGMLTLVLLAIASARM